MSVSADRLRSDEIDNTEYTVEDLIKLEDNKIFIRIRSDGRMFEIEFGPENLRDPINVSGPQYFEQQYLDALRHSFSDDEDDKASAHSERKDGFDTATSPISSGCCDEEDPVISFALGPFLAHETFRTFAPKSSTPCLNTLHDALSPPLLSFSLRVVDEKLVPINLCQGHGERTSDPPWTCVLRSKHWLEYPRLKARDIALTQTSKSPPNMNLVVLNNRVSWFKPIVAGIDKHPYIREIDMLFKLSQENFGQVLRFPQLEAIVCDDRNGEIGFINGLILSAIHPSRGTIVELLSRSEGQNLSITLRERWYNDVENMLRILHEKGFIWGDVSPNNLIIDEDENVWIIDFGGGCTEGWVEPEDIETQKGDLEGLKRLKEYLLDMD